MSLERIFYNLIEYNLSCRAWISRDEIGLGRVREKCFKLLKERVLVKRRTFMAEFNITDLNRGIVNISHAAGVCRWNFKIRQIVSNKCHHCLISFRYLESPLYYMHWYTNMPFVVSLYPLDRPWKLEKVSEKSVCIR